MMMSYLWVAANLCLFVFAISSVHAYGEPDSSGHPSWQARASQLVTNFVRVGMFSPPFEK